MQFNETLHKVGHGHDSPPPGFLLELVNFGRRMLDSAGAVELTVINHHPEDALSKLFPIVGPWQGTKGDFVWCAHRLAAILEGLRVHAGFEADWRWTCGVDTTNASSMKYPSREETGVFQVSYDSLGLDKDGKLLALCRRKFGEDFHADEPRTGGPCIRKFIAGMKEDKQVALEYAANLYRLTTRWAGPWNRGEVQKAIWPPSCAELLTLITAKPEIGIAVEPKG
jgi:hypothetical protein